MLRLIQRIICRICLLFSYVGLMLMVSITLLQVSSRFITGNSFVWVEEISRYLLICISLFGSVAVYGNKEMIRLTYFQDKYPVSFKKYADLIVKIFLLVFYFFFIKESFISMYTFALRESPSMGVSLSLFFLVMPISQICVVVIIVLDMIALCFNRIEKTLSREETIEEQ